MMDIDPALSWMSEGLKQISLAQQKPLFQVNMREKRGKNVSFLIEKGQDTDKVQDSSYLIHKNTFAQMIYESFYNQGLTFNNLLPILIILNESQISGFYFPGFYRYDKNEERFEFLREMDSEVEEKVQSFLQTNNIQSAVALGYALVNIDEIVSWDDVVVEIQTAVKSFSQLIQLHGGLKETCLVPTLASGLKKPQPSDFFLSPILITHWIQPQYPLN
ncbi:hypothetical protein SAMN05444487_106167 [Marininema mesophilum]|uniref:Uncharacterized protein n=1 Tax=Marininema mesophilum TaxID=1048340 RepID=A0A1H2WL85_9BACL|nr:hypothetical protein [Marininema mesophilum]SDW81287.1 hypothetical protein SAMN05444487_106167 [Marininema mesophilum]